MKLSTLFSRLFALLGGMLLLAGIVVCFWFQGGAKDSQKVPREAAEKSQELMQAISGGNMEKVSSLLYGNPSLVSEPENLGPAGTLLWEAYRSRLSCTPADVCRGTGNGAKQDVTITAIDLDSTWALVEGRASQLMAAQEEGTADREALARQALLQAAQDVLSGDVPTVSRNVTWNLVLRDGQWWVLPEKALSAALAGKS